MDALVVRWAAFMALARAGDRNGHALDAPPAQRHVAGRRLARMELEPTDQVVVDRAKAFMASPGLAPRDAWR